VQGDIIIPVAILARLTESDEAEFRRVRNTKLRDAWNTEP
jgi:hypothetical protein